jgi:hypothetical protein
MYIAMEPSDNCIFAIERVGGRINNRVGNIAVVCVLVFIIVLIAYKFYTRYYHVNISDEYAKLSGDAMDEVASRLIQSGKRLRNPTPMDNLHIGSTLLINMNDPRGAETYFKRALDQIQTQIHEEKTDADTPFILNRIADLTNAYDEDWDLDAQDALFAYYDATTDWGTRQQTVAHRHADRNENTVPEQITAPLREATTWHSDSQNVHDSLINNELADQFKRLRDSNRKNLELHSLDYAHAAAWLRERFRDDPRNESVCKALQMFDHNYAMQTLGTDVREQDVVGEVWRRIHDTPNEENFNKLREAFADGIIDCVENGNVVCIDGRTKKVMQSLAHLDADPSMGLFHSKSMVRNEMLSRAADIVDSYVGKNGTAPHEVITEYLAGNPTNREDVVALEDEMRKSIADMAADYADKLPDGEIRTIIAQCQDVV